MVKIIKRNRNIEEKKIIQLAKEYNTTTKIIELLLNRGYKEEELYKYIQNEDFFMNAFNSITNCTKAASIIRQYLNNDKAEIYVYADYDCDGVMSATIMNGVLSAIKEAIDSKTKIVIKTPNRSEGYGLSLDWCKKMFPKKTRKDILVITVDNGITKKEEVEYLKSKNVNVIITDHHAPKKDEVPDCLVIDPWLNDTTDSNSLGLCGAAIAYKLCGELLEQYEDDTNFILNYLPNAAIATITDMMPATQENIGIVGYGLWLTKHGYANEAINYYQHYINKDINIKDIAFDIGPQINACGRMGCVEVAINFMNEYDEETLEDIYNTMLSLNDERKELEKSLLNEIMKEDFSNDLVVITHVPNLGGLGGTIASKLVKTYNRPVIVLGGTDDVLHGSARTAMNINLHSLFSLEVEKGNMVNFGGHEASAGVAVEKSKINDLRQSINKTLASLLMEMELNESEEDTIIEVDNIIQLKDINKNTYSPYSNLLYFGTLKAPTFAITDLDVLEARSSSNNPSHLCLNLQDDTCIAKKNRYGKMVGKEIWIWNMMEEYKRIGEPKKVHLIGNLEPDFRNPKFYTFSVQTIIPA